MVLVGGLAAWAIASPNALGCQCESPLTLALSPMGGAREDFWEAVATQKVGENRWGLSAELFESQGVGHCHRHQIDRSHPSK